MKKIISTFILFLLFIPSLSASSVDIDALFSSYSELKGFSGVVEISRKTDDGYEILYQGASTSNDGQIFSIDSIFNIGSVTKLFTTVSILQLSEKDKLDIDDTIVLYFDNVPNDKQDITIRQLLTHTSGICIDYDEDTPLTKEVTKEEAYTRTLNSDLCSTPGSNYIYSNSGMGLLAMIVEDVSGISYESYVYQNIIKPINLDSTTFPDHPEYVDTNLAINGYIDGVYTGNVFDEAYDWRYRGFTSILSTADDITKFIYAIENNVLLNEESVKLMTHEFYPDIKRGVGTRIIKQEDDTYVGHTGVWDYGNTAAFYRIEDGITFVALSNEVSLGWDYPAESLMNSFYAYFPSHSLDNYEAINSISLFEKDKTTPIITQLNKVSAGKLFYINDHQLYQDILIILSLIITLLIIILRNTTKTKPKKNRR